MGPEQPISSPWDVTLGTAGGFQIQDIFVFPVCGCSCSKCPSPPSDSLVIGGSGFFTEHVAGIQMKVVTPLYFLKGKGG